MFKGVRTSFNEPKGELTTSIVLIFTWIDTSLR